ncbi:MAG: 4-hydroxy-tetrahydrodipicolinate reductase [Pirellulaceae bacterium]
MGTIRLAIHGAAGRMGQRLIALAAADPQLQVVAALESPNHPDLGRDAGQRAGVDPLGVPLTASLDQEVDCVIDFSVPEAAERVAGICRQHNLPLVLATTGLNDAEQQQVASVAADIPLVWAPSMSLAVNLAMKLATLAAGALRNCPGGADVEIIERHHRFKKDAPSGTALRFGQLIADAMGISRQVYGRAGQVGQRPHDEIGYHAVRVGDNPGEHTIIFGMLGESLELTVRATNRDCYAVGALQAAKFIVGRPPGVYSMMDVLGL